MPTLLFAILAALRPAAAADAGRDGPQAGRGKPPIRALCLLGGEHHQYEKNMGTLVGELARVLEIRADMVRIDRPPEGKPAAEKATLPSKPEILENPDLRSQYDVILAYHQESYIDLTDQQKDGLLHFVRSGGAWVGMHSAADSFKSWDEYIRMVGGRFETHPPFGDITVQRVLGDHPIVAGLGDFTLKDEFYHLNSCPLSDKDLLLVGASPADKKTRPVAWTRRYGLGRVFYTILGHGPDTFANPNFVRLIAQAITWAVAPRAGSMGSDGFVSLFDGQDLDGWTMTGPGRFVIDRGTLKSEGGMGLLWYHAQRFRDFVLQVDWRAERAEDNSGIFLRVDVMPCTPWDAVASGYEIQICDAGEEKSNTGSIYSFAAASKLASKSPGDWNHFEITVKDQHYEIVLNGERVCAFDGDRGRIGYVGLQNHDPKSVVSFRNIKVKELP